ncbi:hypothetical protein VTL71DRAFT_15894 [Oculimacula yallundae]|uniref:Aminotransferase-like plant mobile domain-containing protein n=1 Tax=Oculimacula yallundae TaxID=86028 RepID=A0ABR4CCX3_9HELO
MSSNIPPHTSVPPTSYRLLSGRGYGRRAEYRIKHCKPPVQRRTALSLETFNTTIAYIAEEFEIFAGGQKEDKKAIQREGNFLEMTKTDENRRRAVESILRGMFIRGRYQAAAFNTIINMLLVFDGATEGATAFWHELQSDWDIIPPHQWRAYTAPLIWLATMIARSFTSLQDVVKTIDRLDILGPHYSGQWCKMFLGGKATIDIPRHWVAWIGVNRADTYEGSGTFACWLPECVDASVLEGTVNEVALKLSESFHEKVAKMEVLYCDYFDINYKRLKTPVRFGKMPKKKDKNLPNAKSKSNTDRGFGKKPRNGDKGLPNINIKSNRIFHSPEQFKQIPKNNNKSLPNVNFKSNPIIHTPGHFGQRPQDNNTGFPNVNIKADRIIHTPGKFGQKPQINDNSLPNININITSNRIIHTPGQFGQKPKNDDKYSTNASSKSKPIILDPEKEAKKPVQKRKRVGSQVPEDVEEPVNKRKRVSSQVAADANEPVNKRKRVNSQVAEDAEEPINKRKRVGSEIVKEAKRPVNKRKRVDSEIAEDAVENEVKNTAAQEHIDNPTPPAKRIKIILRTKKTAGSGS